MAAPCSSTIVPILDGPGSVERVKDHVAGPVSPFGGIGKFNLVERRYKFLGWGYADQVLEPEDAADTVQRISSITGVQAAAAMPWPESNMSVSPRPA